MKAPKQNLNIFCKRILNVKVMQVVLIIDCGNFPHFLFESTHHFIGCIQIRKNQPVYVK